MIQQNKKIAIFDFDETLCATNGLVKRVDRLKPPDKSLTLMTPGEYSDWRETGEYEEDPKRWLLDFTDFSGYPKNGTVIEETFHDLKKYLSLTEEYIVILVTGRDELIGPKKFLQDQGIDTSSIYFYCSGSPNKKMCYESLIVTFSPSSIVIYEDGLSYIRQCSDMCDLHNVEFKSVLVGDGKIKWNWTTRRHI